MADRRSVPRFSLILVAEVTELSSGARLTARTSDVSRAGCYIDTINPVPVGSTISIKLTQGAESFEAHGKVIYVSPGLGMGVAFEKNVASGQLAILDRWLLQLACSNR